MIFATEQNFVQPAIQSKSLGEKVSYRLTDDYCFEYVDMGIRYRRIVFMDDPISEEETDTDLASTPDGAAVIGFRKLGTSDGAAVMHDRGYEIFGEKKLKSFPAMEFQAFIYDKWITIDRKWTRLDCDKLYRRMCIAGGMPVWRANVEFLALRLGAVHHSLRWYFS